MRARISFEDPEGKTASVDLTPEVEATIGRSRDNTIVLRDEHSSRLHAKVSWKESRWVIFDYGLNGTRVDGQRIQVESNLDDGQEIRIGDTKMRFRTNVIADGTPTAQPPSSIQRKPERSAAETAHLTFDGLSLVSDFLTRLGDDTPTPELLQHGMQLLMLQTGSTSAAAVTLEPNAPKVKQSYPPTAEIPQAIMRSLVRHLIRESGPTIVSQHLSDRTGDLGKATDALGVVVKAESSSFLALVLFKSSSKFSQADGRFAETLAGLLGRHLHHRRAQAKLEADRARLGDGATDELVGQSEVMGHLRRAMTALANSNAPVHFQGERGTGKELAASLLHKSGPRAGGPFVVVHCAGLDADQAELELFGYAKGAFAGAEKSSPGVIDQADGGVLFLDGVDSLPPDVQQRIAAVIATGRFPRFGGGPDVAIDVVVSTASRSPLASLQANGSIEAALYEQLARSVLDLPSLSSRPDDVPELVQHFLDRLSHAHRRRWALAPAAADFLRSMPWPGQVDQLKATAEAVALAAESDLLSAADFRGICRG